MGIGYSSIDICIIVYACLNTYLDNELIVYVWKYFVYASLFFSNNMRMDYNVSSIWLETSPLLISLARLFYHKIHTCIFDLNATVDDDAPVINRFYK